MAEDRIKTSIQAVFEAGGVKAKGEVRNIAESGLFVGTGSIPEEGEEVLVAMRAPGGATIEVRGLVWWTTASAESGHHRKPGFGLRLLETGLDYAGLLESIKSDSIKSLERVRRAPTLRRLRAQSR
jgi:Tfp pilus assembly protein PilZ